MCVSGCVYVCVCVCIRGHKYILNLSLCFT